jgi:WD40 repeat protein/DNA-binding XRE family transcriptional regulator
MAESETRASFGQRLRQARQAAGLTQEELAERAHLSWRGISDLERGMRVTPRRETVALLAEALGLTPDALEATLSRAAVSPLPAPPATAPPAADTPFVFICYAHADRAAVGALAADLRVHGLGGWMGDEALSVGTRPWEQAQRAAIRAAGAVVLVATPHVQRSRYVPDELRIAEMYRRPVYPLWLSGEEWMECVPLGWGGTQYLDARGAAYAAALDQLVATLKAEADQVTPARPASARAEVDRGGLPAAPVAPRNPFKGLRAFDREDAGDFFGRERLVATLLAALAPAQPDGPRLLAVLGPSGSGKSSVVRAGLLPRLQAGALPGSASWVYLEPIVPGTHPLEALAVTLNNALPGSSLTAIQADLETSGRGLHLLARRLAAHPGGQVVLVLDQAEELFTLTYAEEERRHAIDLLVTAVTEVGGPLRAILTLRADFYDRVLQYPALGALVHAHNVPVLPMTLADLRDVIEQPAALPDVQVEFEADLVGDLLFEVSGQVGALPLLEFTLDQLFERREGRCLTVAAYHALGGVRGALARQAEATYGGLGSDEQRRLARTLFLRLIDPGASEQDTTRRRAGLGELALPDAPRSELLRAVADAFIAARLLVTAEHGGVASIEVSHEALIREWGRLGEWVHEARDDVRLQGRVSADAAEWERHDRPVDSLYRGTVLLEAREWAARNTPSALEAYFLAAAEAQEQRREAAERERTVRELELARTAVAAGRQAAVRLRALVGVLAVFLLVAAGLSVVALRNAATARDESRRAIAERQLGLSRQLAADTMAHLDDRYDLALLLSLEARRVADTVEARSSLLAAVESHPAGLITFLQGHRRDVGGLALSPDGKLLASGSADGVVRLWDAARLRSRGPPLQKDTAGVNGLAFSPDGTMLASSHADGAIWLWDAAHGRPLGRPLHGDSAGVNGVAFSPDGKTLAAANYDGTILLWDVARRRLREGGLGVLGSSVMNNVAFSPDGKLLAFTEVDGSVQVWNVALQIPVAPVDVLTGAALGVAFSPDGKLLAYSGVDGSVRLWDVAHERASGKPLNGHTGPVNCLAFSPNGRLLASGGADKTVRLWDVAQRRLLGQPLQSHTGAVESLVFSRDGKLLFAGTEDGAIAAWDATGRLARGQTYIGDPMSIWGVAFSSNGKILAAGGNNGSILQAWDVAQGTPLQQGLAPGGGSLAFRPDGKVLESGTVQLGGVGRKQELGFQLLGQTLSVAYRPDGKVLASGNADGTLQFWDAVREKPLGRPLHTNLGRVLTVAFSPDGKLLAAAGDSTAIQLWDVARHQLLAPLLLGHTSGVDSLSFSPDGEILASTGWDLTVRLWDVASRQPLGVPLTGHTARVTGVAFSPNGKLVASGSWDGTVLLSSVDVGPACRLANRNLTLQEWRQYLPDEPYHKTCPGVP